MRFTSIRTDKNKQMRLCVHEAAWFMERMTYETQECLISGFRDFLKRGSRWGSYMKIDKIARVCVNADFHRTPMGMSWEVGRARPYPRPRRYSADRQRGAVGRVVPHVVPGNGGTVAGARPPLWQQHRAATHLSTGYAQEHLLPLATAAGVALVGLH